MIAFWLFAALMIGAALWLLVPPLARRPRASSVLDENAGNLVVLREQLAQIDVEHAGGALDEAQHRRARDELERRVIDEERTARQGAKPGPATGTAWALAVVLPLFAVAAYSWLGAPQAVLSSRSAGGDAAAADRNTPSPQEVEAMVEKLAQRMRAEPGDPRGWAMLGRSYAALQRFDQASAAYAKAVALKPDDAQLLADYADALAMTQGQSLVGAPAQLIERALQADPANLKALALAGSAAMERKDYAAAVAYWQQALQKVPPGSELANAIEGSLKEAQAAVPSKLPADAKAPATGATVAQAAPTVPAAAAPAVSAAASATQVSGRVSLAPALAARVQPGDTVFIFARAADGPRMPLAIVRRNASEMPIAFSLDDSMAMSPGMKLSNFPMLVVAARISRSGDAMPRSGDLQGQSGPVRAGSAGLEIVIDSVQP